MLGHHISSKGIGAHPAKVKSYFNLQDLRNKKDVRRFHGHARYYYRFINDFNNIASPTFSLLTKDTYFEWSEECQVSLEAIK